MSLTQPLSIQPTPHAILSLRGLLMNTKKATVSNKQHQPKTSRLLSAAKIALLGAALTILPLSAGAAEETQPKQSSTSAPRKVHFMKRDIKMAGNLYVPAGFKSSAKYPAIVVVHPGGGVKEQTAGLYAQKLA